MCQEYKEFWAGRTVYQFCDFCRKNKKSRGIGPGNIVDVLSQCWDCHAEQTYPVSLQGILFREVQEYEQKLLQEEYETEDQCDGRHGASCWRCSQ